MKKYITVYLILLFQCFMTTISVAQSNEALKIEVAATESAFSKAQAMAGLRVGYGLAHPDILAKIMKFGCGPASISMVAFGAVQGALQDIEHSKRSRAHVENCRAYFEGEAANLGIETVSGVPPFILFEMAGRGKDIVAELRKRKILINHAATWNMPDYIRISYGLQSENEAFFKAFKEILS
jgi:histidinol-phosphate aminotransferase